MSTTFRIDRYRPSDRPALYEICLRTADDGQDATRLFRDPYLPGHLYLAPYVELEPQLALVLRPEAAGVGASGDAGARGPGHPVGYVVGTADTVAFEAALAERWLPALRELYPLEAPYPPADAHYVRLLHESPGADRPWLPDYPAHLHVDLLPEAQGGGRGRALLEQFFAELRARGVPGVHVGVSSDNPGAIGFYEHIGMSVLARGAGGQAMGMRLRR